MILSAITAADLDEVLALERRSFAEPWTRGMFLHELKLPFSKTILARADAPAHALIGYICRWLVGDEIQILNVAVDPPGAANDSAALWCSWCLMRLPRRESGS